MGREEKNKIRKGEKKRLHFLPPQKEGKGEATPVLTVVKIGGKGKKGDESLPRTNNRGEKNGGKAKWLTSTSGGEKKDQYGLLS